MGCGASKAPPAPPAAAPDGEPPTLVVEGQARVPAQASPPAQKMLLPYSPVGAGSPTPWAADTVESWLTSLDLGEYWAQFEEAGYDDMETVMDMEESDLVEDCKIVKKGHVKKLLANIAKRKEMSTLSPLSATSQVSPMWTPQPRGSQALHRRRKASIQAETDAMNDMGSLSNLGLATDSDASPTPGTSATPKPANRGRRASIEQEHLALEFAEYEEPEEYEIPPDLPNDSAESTADESSAAAARADTRDDLTLSSLTEIGTLGVGTFSRVKMVQITGTEETYALKIMKKTVIEERKQKEHVMNEKNIMLEMTGHPFLLQLRATFKDDTYLYMLLELCQGGELFMRLLDEQILSEDSTRFYCAGIILALEALHGKNNIYRDLKPENILLDTQGYIKIGDFGFAKKVKDRTFTRCGTPEYVSPEMLSRHGHGKATDYWSLGIFMYECLHGTTPFAAKNYLSTYKKIAAYTRHCKLKWQHDISEEVKSVVQGLLHPKVEQRLGTSKGGIETLKAHDWFATAGLDWQRLLAKEVEAPWIPEVAGTTDLTFFQPDDGQHITDKEDGDEYVGDGAWFDSF